MKRTLATIFAASLALGCDDGASKSDEAAPEPKAANPETVAAEQDDPEAKAATDEDAKPSVTSGLKAKRSKKSVRKTEKVEREAADPMAGKREAEKTDTDPALRKLKLAAIGKSLEVPEGSLDHFYTMLAPLASGEGAKGDDPHVVRVLHIGDSFIGQDVFPYAVRRRMQDRFGNAGPGFQLVDIHHRSNIHRGINLRSSHFRTCFVRDKCLDKEDGHYGYGGHVSRGGPGATSWLVPRRPEAFASGKGHVEIWYQTHPKGGALDITLGEVHESIDTKSDTVVDAWKRVPLGAEDLELKLKATGKGRLRAYGVVFETGESGVVWDSTVHTATFANRVLAQDPEHFKGQIAHRKVDMLVYNFGGNDLRRVAKGNLTRATLQKELEAAIALYQSGRPEMSCLVVSSTDHAKSGGTPVFPKHVERVVGAQRDAALARGCAFFNSVEVFGGPGRASKLAHRKNPLVGHDLSHLTSLGRELLADVLVEELVRHMPGHEAAAEAPAAPADE